MNRTRTVASITGLVALVVILGTGGPTLAIADSPWDSQGHPGRPAIAAGTSDSPWD